MTYAIRYRTAGRGWQVYPHARSHGIARFDSLLVARAVVKRIEPKLHDLEKLEIFEVGDPQKTHDPRPTTRT